MLAPEGIHNCLDAPFETRLIRTLARTIMQRRECYTACARGGYALLFAGLVACGI